jgi:DNA-binding response OmpR family regulator
MQPLSILIVEDDPGLRSALARELKRRGFMVTVAETVDEALDVLINSRVLSGAPIDVLLADLRLSGWDGLDLLRAVHKVSSTTRSILMSGFATAKDHQVARDLGAVAVLTKPFTNEDLLSAIEKASECKTGFHGEIHGLSLIDMIQMFHFARRSVTISVGGTTEGQIHLRDGEIVHAQTAATTGEQALRDLLAAQGGFLRTAALAQGVPATIGRPFEPLLLDLLRQIDESPKGGFSR